MDIKVNDIVRMLAWPADHINSHARVTHVILDDPFDPLVRVSNTNMPFQGTLTSYLTSTKWVEVI